MNAKSRQINSESKRQQPAAQKHYETPQIFFFGDIRRLTKGNTTGFTDSGNTTAFA